jgi:predicted TIM-barrel fold metal-dependent hydrolase
MTTQHKRIDVHHHVLPPHFVAAQNRRGVDWTGGPGAPRWNLDLALETMERHDIATAMASVAPGVFWGDEALAIELARHSNEFLARIVHDDPVRFGGFATLPLPAVDASLRELEYGLDTLGLDGVVLFSSQGNRYLGDPGFDPLFQELNRRSAVVFIHPTTVPPGSDVSGLSIPYSLVDFVFDTTRAVTNLLYSGTFERYPAIRYIVSHAGGAVPYLAWRLGLGELRPDLRARVPQGAAHYLRRLYYDTALSATEQVFASLRQFVPTSQILFGSDFPYLPDRLIEAETEGVDKSSVLDDGLRAAVNRGNALALFPRLVEHQATSRTASSPGLSTQP